MILVQNGIDAISLGAVYALAALGVGLIFSIMRLINFAHGELIMGGGFALLLAPDHGYDVASVNYGMVPKDAPDLLTRACPVVGSFGGRDQALRGAAARLASALAAAGVGHDVTTSR